MSILPTLTADEGDDPPVVLDAELVPLVEVLPRPLQYPPAIPESLVLTTCRCGNVTERGHNGYSCPEVLEIRAGVEGDDHRPAWRAYVLPAVGLLAALGAAAGVVWLIVLGVTAVVSMVTAVAAWLSANWPAIAAVAVALLLLGAGGAKCAGLHFGGCRG